jgi:hypothetical protein
MPCHREHELKQTKGFFLVMAFQCIWFLSEGFLSSLPALPHTSSFAAAQRHGG